MVVCQNRLNLLKIIMSSIYRKGRDGYFYYQTYSINSETGKKDKKIFHSLGTKDRIEAEKQKSLLDQKYAEKGRRKKFLPIS